MRIQTYMVPMRDGVELFTAVYLPDAPGKYPAVLVRNPYGDPGSIGAHSEWTEENICEIRQDVRGTLRSGGTFYPYFQEINDGCDTLDWIAAQPWFNGRLVMTGGSYLSNLQWPLAGTGHPVLCAVSPSISTADLLESPRFRNGCFLLGMSMTWLFGMAIPRQAPGCRPDYPSLMKHVPLRTADEASGIGVLPYWRDFLSSSPDSDFWSRMRIRNYVKNIRVPALIDSGWFDMYPQISLDAFTLMRRCAATDKARNYTRCIIGPWAHGEAIGELAAGPGFSRAECLDPIRKRYLRNMLADLEKDPLEGEPKVRFFVMGANRWRSAESWPPPESRMKTWYIGSCSPANSRFGGGILAEMPFADSGNDVFVDNPDSPVPTRGGSLPGIGPAGSFDRSDIEMRSDLLVYTTPPLEKELEIAGTPLVRMSASSSAPDTNFIVRLVDVFPDGRALNLTEGVLRTHWRNGYEQPAPPLNGETVEYTIPMWSTAYLFGCGHRVRLEIASTDFPGIARNPNTGEDPADALEYRIAVQTIFHGGEYSSVLELPVL